MKKQNTYSIEYIDYDENHIPYINTTEIKADSEHLAIIEFRMLYGCEIMGIY